ncbi:hypothetical protein SDC9_136791 [bioreactor metagenome]|uniref:ACT domain-containing protein n=1 Tax=bioreactor metagenome TaxID=1076179 RepID=A0A645DK46_9ZZZZ
MVIHRLLEELKKKIPETLPDTRELLDQIQLGGKKKESAGIIIDDIDNIAVKLARCCNPIPGDPIVGYVTRGRGVSIHHRDCTNIVGVQEQGRLLPAKWGSKKVGPFIVALTVTALDYVGLLQQILLSISDSKASIAQIKARTNKSGLALVDLHIEVKDKEHMDGIVEKLKKIRDVYHVEHMTHRKG